MSQPTDATHRNAGGDLFKRELYGTAWLQWSVDSDTWFWVGQTAEPLVEIGAPAPAPAPAKPFPHDATHDDMEGRAYKQSKIDLNWYRYNDATGRWADIGQLTTTAHLIPRKAPAPAGPPPIGVPVQPSKPEPVYPRRVTTFETADGQLHESEEAATKHMLQRDVQALLNARHNHLGMDEDGFIEDLLAHYELRQK